MCPARAKLARRNCTTPRPGGAGGPAAGRRRQAALARTSVTGRPPGRPQDDVGVGAHSAPPPRTPLKCVFTWSATRGPAWAAPAQHSSRPAARPVVVRLIRALPPPPRGPAAPRRRPSRAGTIPGRRGRGQPGPRHRGVPGVGSARPVAVADEEGLPLLVGVGAAPAVAGPWPGGQLFDRPPLRTAPRRPRAAAGGPAFPGIPTPTGASPRSRHGPCLGA